MYPVQDVHKPGNTVDGCEILHQLIDGKHPIIHRVSTILLVVQEFAGPSTVWVENCAATEP